MSHNTFGHLFRVTTFGESHGPSIGCVIDGCPPGLPLDAADLQRDLDRRRPGASRYTSQRREPDLARIVSGVYAGDDGVARTTGAPIAVVIDNVDARPRDYDALAEVYRPGHADWTWERKYGLRDPRGGGRSSARETAARVAAGAVARKVIAGVTVRGALVQLGALRVDRARWDWDEVARNDLFCPDAEAAARFAEHLEAVRKAGSSVGAVVEVVAEGVPPGLGAPVYGKLDADLAAALMGIPAVKGVEVGDGFAAAALRGEDNADRMRPGDDGGVVFESNHAGGVLGGVSTGQPVVVRFAVKPTSSILAAQPTVDRRGRAAEVRARGRHDPCVGVRAVPVGEAMVACVLADHLLRDRAQVGARPPWPRP